MKKSYIIIGIIVALVIVAIVCFAIYNNRIKDNTNTVEPTSQEENNTEQNIVNNEENEESEVNDMYSSGTHHAQIVVKDYGTISLELYADIAPITVSNFAKLVNEGFYNGLTFHRIISGFMIQGGDPLGDGTGGSDKEIKGEFELNGIKNNISHTRGVISMARAQDYNSASSQFFIVHEDSTFLDGQYAGFGRVLEGMEIVDKICENTQVEDDNGTVLKENQPVIEKIVMDD